MERNSSLSSLAMNGVVWSGMSSLAMTLIMFIITTVLARILAPSELGLVSLAIVVTGFFATMNDLGISAGIIQRKEVSQVLLSTCFWINLLVGILLWMALWVLAPLVAGFYQEPGLVKIISVLGVTFAFTPLGVVHRAALTKELRFRDLAIVDILAVFVAGGVGIGAALNGWGSMSIAIQELVRAVLRVLIVWVILPWRPSWSFNWAEFKSLFGFGSNVMGSSIVNYLIANFDSLIIGKMFGSAPLGFYSIAQNLATLPQSRLAPLITRVTFPLFSKVQDNRDRLRKGYLRSVFYIAVITFPLLFGLFTLAPEFITVFLGDKWLPSVSITRILCVAGAVYSIATTAGSVLLSTGRSDLMFFLTLVRMILLGGLIIFGAVWNGPVGVAVGVSTYSILVFPLVLWFVYRSSTIPPSEVLLAMKWPFLSSLIMLAVLFGYKWLWQEAGLSLQSIVFLTSAVLLGGGIYAGLIWMTNKAIVLETVSLARTSFGLGKV